MTPPPARATQDTPLQHSLDASQPSLEPYPSILIQHAPHISNPNVRATQNMPPWHSLDASQPQSLELHPSTLIQHASLISNPNCSLILRLAPQIWPKNPIRLTLRIKCLSQRKAKLLHDPFISKNNSIEWRILLCNWLWPIDC